MRGILFLLTNLDENGEKAEQPVITILDGTRQLDHEQVPYGDTIEGALALVKHQERHNVMFDHMDAPAEDIALRDQQLAEIEAMRWSDTTNANGQYTLDSVWAGPLAEEGFEYRFAPVAV